MDNYAVQNGVGRTKHLLDLEPGCHNLGVLWPAIRRLLPKLSCAYAMGALGALGRYGFCSPGCCRANRSLSDRYLSRLPAIGLKAQELQLYGLSVDEAAAKIRKLVIKGIPLIVYASDSEGILACEIPEQLRIDYIYISPQATWVSTALAPALIANARVFAIRRSYAPLGARRRREMFALADWAAAEVLPPIECISGRNHKTVLVARGLNAYDDALAALAGCKNWRCARQIDGWAEFMLHHRAACSDFLFGLAGSGRTRYHNRLRDAGNWYAAEVEEAIKPVRLLLAKRRRVPYDAAVNQAQEFVRMAGECAAYAHRALMEAVVIGVHLSPAAASALIHDPLDPLHGIELKELIYLARAGLNPIRQLAARRLAGSDHPQAIATLRQLVFDPDPETSQMAQWSLGQIDPTGLEEVRAALRDKIASANG